MAQYRKEIQKWSSILIDKLFLERSFDLKEPELSVEEAHILHSIEDGMSPAEFYQIYSVNRSKANQLLQKFIQEGYLEKVPLPSDGRKRILLKTEKAERTNSNWEEKTNEILDQILSGLTVNEEKAVLKFISKIYQQTVEKYKP
ncbi:MarR family winged helix-turn-helix transcriptional regulator [Guggenheimella bovis]